jgi:hypothetical protein
MQKQSTPSKNLISRAAQIVHRIKVHSARGINFKEREYCDRIK